MISVSGMENGLCRIIGPDRSAVRVCTWLVSCEIHLRVHSDLEINLEENRYSWTRFSEEEANCDSISPNSSDC